MDRPLARIPVPPVGGRAGLLFLVCWALAGRLPAAQEPAPASRAAFRFEREVKPGGARPNRLLVDQALLVSSERLRYLDALDADGKPQPVFAGGLGDLRLFDAADREVPYLLVSPPDVTARWTDATRLPVAATRQKSGFEADIGALRVVDRMELFGLPAPFVKKFRLEGSGDRSHWTVLTAEGTLFDLPEESLRRTHVDFAPGEYRYLRLIWDDRSSHRLPSPSRVRVRVPGTIVSPAPVRLVVEFARLASEPGKSRFMIRLAGAHLPIVAVDIMVGESTLDRVANVTEARLQGSQVVAHALGSAPLRMVRHGDLTASDLRIPIARPEEPELQLVVEDRDNPPLDLKEVSVELAPLPWIYFESSDGAPLMARYGVRGMAPPRYDLEAKRKMIESATMVDAHWGEARDLVAAGPPVPQTSPIPLVGAELEVQKFEYSRTIPEGRPGLTSLQLDAAVLAHGDTVQSELGDIRIVDSGGRQVPYLLERRGEPLTLPLHVPQRTVDKKEGGAGTMSRYLLDFPYETLPECTLVLKTTARVFDRWVSVQAERHPVDTREEPWVETLAQGQWIHAAEERAAPAMALALKAPRTARLIVLVDEGDNSPLPIKSAEILLPAYRLRFFYGAGARLSLYYGQPGLRPPRYDLALLAPRLMGAQAHELALSPETVVPKPPSTAPMQKKLFWGALVAVAVVLLLLLVRLLVRPGGAGGERGPGEEGRASPQ
ncbi:MAG: DUF3999 family protein [Acidobacteriota bacterium]